MDPAGTTADAGVIAGFADASIDRLAWSANGRLALVGDPTGAGIGIYGLDARAGPPGEKAIVRLADAADEGCAAERVDGIAWAGSSIVWTPAPDGESEDCQYARMVRLDPATHARAPVADMLGVGRWAVSADGQAIAAIVDDGSGEGPVLAVVDVATGATRAAGSAAWKSVPAWSPDGPSPRILFVDSLGPGGHLIAAAPDPNVATVDLTPLAAGLTGFSNVGWGGDDATVMFRSWRAGCPGACGGLYRLDLGADAPLPVLVTALPDGSLDWGTGYGYDFAWSLSPDGGLVAYEVTPAPGRPNQVLVVDASGGAAPDAISEESVGAHLEGWAAPGVVAYRTEAGLVLAKADGSGRVLVGGPDVTAVALRSGSVVSGE